MSFIKLFHAGIMRMLENGDFAFRSAPTSFSSHSNLSITLGNALKQIITIRLPYFNHVNVFEEPYAKAV